MKNNYFSIAICKNSFLRILFVLLIVLFLCADLFPQISRTINFDINSLSLTSEMAADNNEYLHVTLSKLYPTGEVGAPELPVKYLKLLLPPNTRVKDITISNITKTSKNIEYKIFPGQFPEPTGINWGEQKFISPDKNIYGSTNPFPAKVVQVIDHSYFDGNNHIVTIAIYPVQYFPLENKLEISTDISYNLVLENNTGNLSVKPKSRTPEHQKTYDKILKAIIDNQEDIPVYQIKPLSFRKEPVMQNLLSTQDAIPFYEYVIITTDALKNSFKRFVDWKLRKGINIGVVTIEDVIANYPEGDDVSNIMDDAGSLRQYLSDGYESGVTVYALLADSLLPNNQHSIPIRYGCGEDNKWIITKTYPQIPDGNHVPADLYFSEFSGNWNVDNDQYTGEATDDDVIYDPNIFVGRLYFANSSEVSSWIAKEIEYEQNPFNGNFSKTSKVLWVQADQLQANGEPESVRTSNTYLSNLPYWMLGEYPSADSYTPTYPGGIDVINKINEGYGFWNIYNHGESVDIAVRCKGLHMLYDPNYVQSYAGVFNLNSMGENHDIPEDGNGLDNITADNTSTIVYSIACDVAQPDDINHYRSFADIYTTLNKSGGTAFLGNTRVGWISNSFQLHKKFVDALYVGDLYNLGQSEATSKSSNTWEKHYLALSHNLLGDPEMPIWTAVPSQLSNVTVSDGGSSITVNAGISDSKICVSSINNGASYYNVQEVSGTSFTFTTSVRPLIVTVTKHNYIPYMAITGGTISSNATFFNNAKVLSNLTINSGVSLAVQPGVKLNFLNGSSLIVNGTLQSNGTSVDKIEFDFTAQNSTTQNGIKFNAGSNGNINNAIIKNGYYGVSVTGNPSGTTNITNSAISNSSYALYVTSNTSSNVNITGCDIGTSSGGIYFNSGVANVDGCSIHNITNYGGGAVVFNNSGGTIKNCSIQNNSGITNGISILNNSSPIVFQNTIANNTLNGIYVDHASPSLQSNAISTTGYDHAAVSNNNYSYTLFGKTSYPYDGYNTISGSYYGIYVSNHSTIQAGYTDIARDNRILNNSNRNTYVIGTSTLYAKNDWWGIPVNTAKFYTETGSYFYYLPYLTEDPLGSQSIVSSRDLTAEENVTSSTTNYSPEEELLLKAKELQQKHQTSEAIRIYRELIKTYEDKSISEIALVELCNIYRQTKDKNEKDYLENFKLPKNNKNRLYPIALELLSHINKEEGNNSEALADCETMIKAFPSTEYEKNALMDKFFLYYDNKDFTSAKTVVEKLTNSFSESPEIAAAINLLGLEELGKEYFPPQVNPEDNMKKDTLSANYEINNYPNPFNPITTITYQLPKSGNVTLKIFDILGNEVKTLINEQKEMGKYSVQFDASSFASGMYIYQLRVNDYTSTKKMLLLK